MRNPGLWRSIRLLFVVLLLALPARAQIVTTTADSGAGSLRAAITFANANPGTTITFALNRADSGFDGQTYTIRPLSDLPAIAATGTVIDGASQTALGNTNAAGPEIVLDGGGLSIGSNPGLQITAANCTIDSLVVNGFSRAYGIRVTGTGATGNTISGCYVGTNATGTAASANNAGILLDNGASRNLIGGTTVTARNVISGNSVDGIHIEGSTTTLNTVSGNYIGLNAAGTAGLGNGNIGVQVIAPRNTIGGTTAGARNVVSANAWNGIGLTGTGGFTTGNVVQGNYVGTDAAGSRDLGNARPGIAMGQGASSNLIGGTAAGAGNVVSGNVGGISMFNAGTNNNVVQGNLVGLAADGVSRLGNTAVGIEIDLSARSNVIGGTAAGAANRIAYNTNSGIRVGGGTATTGNSIRANTIFGNAGLGINLEDATEPADAFTARRPTPNDTGDTDTGPNNLQNFPVLTVRQTSATVYTVSAQLDSRPSTNYALDLYRNNAADALGYGEGETYIRSLTVATNAAGVATAATTVTVPAGSPTQFFTMTATNLTTGDTSEFSASTTVSAATATLTLAIAPTSFSEGAGTAAATGTLTRTGSLTAALPVTLTSSDTSEATVPASVTIPVGSARATFLVAAVDDALVDGSQTTVVTAGATGFATSRVSLTVTDNDSASGPGLLAWGDNAFGQLGNGTLSSGATPVAVRNSAGVTAVAAGGSHSLALLSTGTVISWGYNGVGQLGDGTRRDRSIPGAVVGLTNATAIAAGWYHSMALLADGRVMAWGVNRRGQLGIGSTTISLTPRVVPGLTNIVAIAAGVEHSLALRRDGVVFAWGANESGQIGDGSQGIDRFVPVAVRGLSGVTAIAGGAAHSLAVAGGAVYAWGDNSYGQLGLGNQTSHAVPQRIAGLSGIRAVEAGYIHSAALSSTGRVFSWGNNLYGQLGDGTTSDKNSPVAVPGLSAVVHLAVGTAHNVALLSSGQLYTWGFNLSSATGNSGSASVLRPTLLPTLTGVTMVSAGYAHNLSNGSVRRAAAVDLPGSRSAFSAAALLPGGVMLQFEGALDPVVANDASHYGLWIDGRRVAVESAKYYPGSGRVVLVPHESTFASGGQLRVAWQGLQTGAGAAIENGSSLLTVR